MAEDLEVISEKLEEYINQAIIEADSWYCHSKDFNKCYSNLVSNLYSMLSIVKENNK